MHIELFESTDSLKIVGLEVTTSACGTTPPAITTWSKTFTKLDAKIVAVLGVIDAIDSLEMSDGRQFPRIDCSTSGGKRARFIVSVAKRDRKIQYFLIEKKNEAQCNCNIEMAAWNRKMKICRWSQTTGKTDILWHMCCNEFHERNSMFKLVACWGAYKHISIWRLACHGSCHQTRISNAICDYQKTCRRYDRIRLFLAELKKHHAHADVYYLEKRNTILSLSSFYRIIKTISVF